jgi:hypothetical protein
MTVMLQHGDILWPDNSIRVVKSSFSSTMRLEINVCPRSWTNTVTVILRNYPRFDEDMLDDQGRREHSVKRLATVVLELSSIYQQKLEFKPENNYLTFQHLLSSFDFFDESGIDERIVLG